MNTKQIGDETEARIIAALIAEGHSVSVPFGDNDKYDLVLDIPTIDSSECSVKLDGSKTKSFDSKRPVKRLSTETSRWTGTMERLMRSLSDVKTTKNCTGCQLRDVGKKSTYLRLSEPKIDHPSVNLPKHTASRFDCRD